MSELQEEKNTYKVPDRDNKNVFFRKRKGCPLSEKSTPPIDYKNPELLAKFTSEGGRILPSRITNVCARKQKQLTRAIKIARLLGLLHFVFQSK